MRRQTRRPQKNSVKFMQVLERRIMNGLERLARRRGITVQELLRAVIIPEWRAQVKAKEDQAAAFLERYLKTADQLAKKHSRSRKNRIARRRR